MAPVIKPKPQQQANEAQAAVQQVQEVQEAEPAQEQVAQERVSQGELTIPERSIVRQMADRYHMEPKPFQHAVMDTCFPPSNKPGDRQISPAEFAAFLLIAFEHGLNPIRREIYGFRAKNGAIVPVVGVDGWANIVNQHKQMDGLEFDEHFSEGQNEAKDRPTRSPAGSIARTATTRSRSPSIWLSARRTPSPGRSGRAGCCATRP
jgi:hypothetical protein